MVLLKRKANFGCGTDILDGYENYDLYPMDIRVKKFDVNQLPYSFPDDTFDEVVCRHVLEHLTVNAYDVLCEFRRITKKDGRVVVELPIFGNLVSHNRFYHSRNYMNPVLVRRKDNAYISNQFVLSVFSKRQKCNIWKVLWKVKTRFFTWVDSFLYDSYEWDMRVRK